MRKKSSRIDFIVHYYVELILFRILEIGVQP